MKLKGIMLSEIHSREKDKYHMISLTCGILNKIKPTKANIFENNPCPGVKIQTNE